MHGGATPVGTDLPYTKSGKYSKYLPPNLAETYERILGDEQLLELRNEIALIDVCIIESLESLTKLVEDNAEDPAGERRSARAQLDLIDLRRKLVETEQKRVQTMNGILTLDQVMLVVNAMLAVVQEEVTDAAMLERIQRGIRRLLYRPEPPAQLQEENHDHTD